MNDKTDSELISIYEALVQAQHDGTFEAADAVTLVTVSVELGRRGYTLTEDESTWIRGDETNGKV